MNRLQVGLSTTTIEPTLTRGWLDGIGVYTNALMHHLPAVGCTVAGFSYPPLQDRKRAWQFAGNAMPHPFSVLSMRDLLTPSRVCSVMPVDIYHATDYRLVRMACPVVATLHDAVPLKYPEWCQPRLRRLKNWWQKKAAHHADHVIALSNFAVAELVEYFKIDERRITVVHCGVGQQWHQTPSPEAVAQTLNDYGLEYGYFLFVGTLQPRKNVERILEAYLGLPGVVRRARPLVIVGHIGWRCEALIKKMHAAMQNAEKIMWIDDLTAEDQLRRIYAGAAALVFPSLHEGFGLPVAEAFACGVPVITANTTSLPEVSQGAALEIDPLSVKEIGAAMLDIVQDAALRKRCIAAGKKRASELTWSRAAQQMVQVYHCVLGRACHETDGPLENQTKTHAGNHACFTRL